MPRREKQALSESTAPFACALLMAPKNFPTSVLQLSKLSLLTGGRGTPPESRERMQELGCQQLLIDTHNGAFDAHS